MAFPGLVQLKAAFRVLGSNLGTTSPQLLNWFSGDPTSSGETVSVDGALRHEVVWSCVRLNAGTIATMPLHLYRRDKADRGQIARDHPLYSVLHDTPNAEMTSVVFWEAMCGCLELWGNAYARKLRNGLGQIIGLVPLRPDRLTPQRRNDGSLVYRYTWKGEDFLIDEQDIMHVKGFSTDGLVGLSPIGQAREAIGLAMAADKAAGSIMRNGMRFGKVFTLPTFLDDRRRDKFKAEYLPEFTGSINAGKVPFLEGGWKVEQLAMNPLDAELIATRQFSIEQLCRMFGVQPVMIGHMDKSTAWGTGLEQMNLWYLTYTLRTRIRAIEQEISRSLLTPVERKQYYAEFNVDGLLRGDSAGRAAILKVYADSGLRTRNEIRALDNMPPLDGGDDLTVNSASVLLKRLGDMPLPGSQQIPGGMPQSAANENKGAA